MLINYANVLIFLGLGVIFAVFTLFIGRFLRPNNPSSEKLSTYECGEEPVGGSWIQFNVRFYVIALIFLIFDVEIVFLYPWAVSLRELGVASLVAVLVLIFIIFIGYLYAWRKKVLEWK